MSLNGEGEGPRKVAVSEGLYHECLSVEGEERIYVKRAAGSTYPAAFSPRLAGRSPTDGELLTPCDLDPP